ncbi:MAG: hypothetical protein RL095_2707 [Verrucomicrobiota bacterium]|jgi:hypothetical protein
MPIEVNEAITLLSKAYPGFRDAFVSRVEQWVADDGQILYYLLISSLTDLLLQRLEAGDYEHAETLFTAVEQLLTDGDEETGNLIATGFLEGLQTQTRIETKLWLPLLGPHALQHCQAMDQFYGIASKNNSSGDARATS